MLRVFLLFSGVISIVGTIVAVLGRRIDLVPPNTILIGLVCLAVADLLRRQELVEKHLNLIDEEEKQVVANRKHPLA